MSEKSCAVVSRSLSLELSEEVRDVLWTGGYDSTFRILYLASVEKVLIQPHYIIDVDRQSSLRELQAISEIREELVRLDKQAACRIKPMKITSIRDIPPDSEITEAYNHLKSWARLGGQYDWLARYAKSNDLSELELGMNADDSFYGFLKAHVDPESKRWILRNEPVSRASDGNADLKIFSNFTFPLLELRKLEMRELAKKYGFITALENAWFCFRPVSGKPCGTCNPCIYSVEEGMSYRFPRSSMVRYRLRHITKVMHLPYRATRKAIRLIQQRT
jgi:hypothetical protein